MQTPTSFSKVLIALFLIATTASSRAASAPGQTCRALENLHLPDTTIVHAEWKLAGDFLSVENRPVLGLPSFCRVILTLTPSPDSEIHAEIWLPEKWNGRMAGSGNGGFAGSISYSSLAEDLKGGYAAANSDMGMAPPAGSNASAFVNRPEHWADWGYRATHEMTVAAKQIIRAYYGRDSAKSYFSGCSTGGEQALTEAQRYPADYDGIVAGAPANYRTGVHVSILWNFAVTRRTPSAVLSASQIALLSSKVLATCDMLDGVRDGVIADPHACRFDPGVLECKGKEGGDCLSAEQVEVVRRVYGGPVNPRTAQSLYPGVSRGGESAWASFGPPLTAEQIPPYKPIFLWVFGSDWDWRTFNFDSDFTQMNLKLGGLLNAVDPDLATYRNLGHKLIVYHGWADWLVPSEESIQYFDAVHRVEAAKGRNNRQTADFYRLFMVPGMQHCGGGSGADEFDAFGAVVAWVEHDTKPDRILAKGTRKSPAPSRFERILCPYPQQAQYDGSGNVDQATSFACAQPK